MISSVDGRDIAVFLFITMLKQHRPAVNNRFDAKVEALAAAASSEIETLDENCKHGLPSPAVLCGCRKRQK